MALGALPGSGGEEAHDLAGPRLGPEDLRRRFEPFEFPA